jgi:hypothetical protein
MHPRSVMVAFLIAAVLSMPLIAAQSADAPHPSSEHTQLYLHGTGDDEFNVFMNTLVEDGNDNALGSGPCNQYIVLPQVGNTGIEDPAYDGEPADLLYTVTLEPALVAPITLDADADAVLTLHLGASSCDSADDPLEVSFLIEAGDVRIAQSAVVPYTWSAGAPYPVLEITAPLLADMIPAGDDLVMTITMEGTFNGVVFIGVSDAQGRSFLELPITSAAPEVGGAAGVVEVTDEVFFQELTNLTEASSVHEFVWSAAPEEADLVLEWIGEATGVATVRITDDTGAIYEGLLFDADDALEDVVFGSPGTWNVSVELEGVTGALALRLQPVELAPTGPGAGDDDHPDDHGDHDDHDHGEHHDDEDDGGRRIPGPALPVLVLLLAAVATVRRR